MSPTDCNLIVKYEETWRRDGASGGSSMNTAKSLMESSDGKLIANAFLDVFRNVSRREAVERALANVCKMLGDPQLAKVSSEYFMPEINKTVTLSNIDAYKALTRLMLNAKNGWFVREKASFILGVLLSKSESLRNESFFSGEEGEEQEAGEEQRCSEEMQTARTVVRWSIDLLGGGDGSLVDASGGDGAGGTMTIQRGGGDENHEENEERVIPTAIHALASVLQHRKTRPLARNLGAYKLIAPLLDSEKFNPNSRVQVLYEAALCAWLLSFDAKARKQALKIDNAIVVKKLINAAKTATKEKVVRVAIMALKNILIGLADSGIDDAKKVPSMKSGEGDRHSNKENAAAAAHVGGKRDDDKDDEDDELGPIAETCIERESLQKVCENLAHRGFEDAELVDNLEQLAKGLAKRRVVASSWERYLTEVRSGSLDWSPSHTDEGFWRNECSKLTDNNCFVLRNLIAMMSSRDVDPRTLAVACHDVGEFATHYPAGRFLACDLGAKTAAMALMVHEDEEVKAKSLVCVQKLLVANWKFIGGGN